MVAPAPRCRQEADMRALVTAVTMAIVLLATPVAAADPAGEPGLASSWYLALGDSLAAGYQPVGDPDGDHMTRAGYPDQLWLMARGRYPRLQLRNLACPGEDTATIRLDNGRCTYEHGSQLAEALAFIEDHRGQLAFITIDIGFNDHECDTSPLCVFTAIANIEERLPPILAELRAAAPDTPIVGMNIYDPFLVYWFEEDTRRLAGQSVVAVQMLNETLEEAYASAGIPVADVEAAFEIDDWGTRVPLAGHGDVPRNLALLCERTWLCHEPPLGPDRHPNVLGHRVMAEAFARELRLDPGGADAG
jgi:lysophospholipase L1-like esterase